MRLSDIDDVLRRVAPQRRRHLPRRRRRGRMPGTAARRLPLLRHAARRSERRRPARAPARAARAEGVRRLDQPRRHEGRQHARYAGHGRTAAASCATTCRTSARRSAPAPTGRANTTKAGSTVSRAARAEAAVHARVLPAAVADRRYEEATRRSAASRATAFDPAEWKPRVPTAAFLRARADDKFWAARRVMAFSDEMIRAHREDRRSTATRRAEKLLADVLIQRRDKIAPRLPDRRSIRSSTVALGGRRQR